jgi:hypothetical protein
MAVLAVDRRDNPGFPIASFEIAQRPASDELGTKTPELVVRYRAGFL